MSVSLQLTAIKNFLENHFQESTGTFNPPVTKDKLRQIELLLGEDLPSEFLELYSFADGQYYDDWGILSGEVFVNTDKIIDVLEFSRTLIKPEAPTIENPEKSNQLLQLIVDFYISKAPKKRFWHTKIPWYKIKFSCSPGSYGGPYLYKNEHTEDYETIDIEMESYQSIEKPIKELYLLEEKSYNWNDLEFIVYADGSYQVERTFFDFDNQIKFTSTPENAIRKKYFHYKWIPIFHDHGGNYIGIDLDPDTQGKKGQIINFGRDEENMHVYADNLSDFLNKFLKEISRPESIILSSDSHPHETLKELKQ